MRVAVAIVLVVLGVACSRTHLAPHKAGTAGSAQDDGRAGASGRNHTDDNAGGASGSNGPSGSTGSNGSSGIRDAGIQPIAGDASFDDPPPIDERPQPELNTREIWVGELWSIAPLLCDPNAPWEATPLIVEPTGYTEPVVLVLEPGSDPTMPSGEIAFGRGDLPEEPGPAATSQGDSGSFWLCSIQIPSKGGVYSMLDVRRKAGRLTFEVVPSEIWSKDCIDRPADCVECVNSCDLLRRRVELDLVVRGDTIEGTLGGAAFGTPSELRLQRMP